MADRVDDIDHPVVKRPRLEDGLESTAEVTSVAEVEPAKVSDSTEAVVPSKPPGEGLEEVVSEKDVGISEFISSHAGFSGIIKQRYSDFLVNEINSQGEVVRLTDLSVPSVKTSHEEEKAAAKSCEFIAEADAVRLQELLTAKDSSGEVLIKVGELSKEIRGKVHKAVRELYHDLESSTIERDGEKYIAVTFFSQKSDRRTDAWPKGAGDFTKFVLYKENKDTLEAINLLSKLLRVKTSCFAYAGTKDRRAKTCQEITAYRLLPQRLSDLNQRLRNLAVGNFSRCKQPLKLGDHNGNRFVILLRNVSGTDEQITEAMNSLKESGFINYYGMQRFGTTRVPTHHVGRALLRGNWAEAVNLILKPREGDRDELAEARLIWSKTKDPVKALDALESFHCMERQLLEGLKRYSKNDLVSALAMVPRNMRLMYIHAYQSYIWNQVVSRKLAKFGMTPQIGDLVFVGVSLDDKDLDEGDETKGPRPTPVFLNSENIAQYSISDIVLPLPGYDVIYPQNVAADWYKELLKLDGMEDYTFRHTVRDYSLPGSYRKLIVRPDDLRWEVIVYDDVQVALVDSDYDNLNGQKSETATVPEITGKFRALKMELNLASSAYATMAVREVLKCGTSAAFQSTLNVT